MSNIKSGAVEGATIPARVGDVVRVKLLHGSAVHTISNIQNSHIIEFEGTDFTAKASQCTLQHRPFIEFDQIIFANDIGENVHKFTDTKQDGRHYVMQGDGSCIFSVPANHPKYEMLHRLPALRNAPDYNPTGER